MTRNTRRHFLTVAGSTLATLGMNQILFQQKAERYGQVLAQSTPRKLALLVGINQYSDQPLEGCVNDLDLQRYLLIHRFGFNPKDIYIVSDRIRSRDGGKNILVSPNEKAYQEQWLSRLNLSREDFVKGYRTGVAKGVVLAATAPTQLAQEANINGFKCGLFSYLLTHYFWQETSNIQEIFKKVIPEIPKDFEQVPRYEVKVGSGYQLQPPYLIESANSPAQAVVTEVKGDNAQLWLGGVDLRKVETGTKFKAINRIGKVQVISREGIVATSKVEESVTEGTPLRLMD